MLPRAIMISVMAVAAIYAAMNLSIIGLVPWREAMQSKTIASDFMERAWGPWAGGAMTVMILWTAMASVFALLLGYSRIPYAAAVEGFFFAPFGWLHPRGGFPHVSLGVIGLLSIAAGMFSLEAVLPALITARILVQFIGQIGALHWLRTKRPDMERPFRMWLYPIPSIVALIGWSYVYLTSGWTYVLYGLAVVGSGVAAFAVWRGRRA